jgi:hypothetical protein
MSEPAAKPDEDGVAYWRRGNAARELGQWQDALLSYGRAVERSPRFAEAHCDRGNVLQKLERWEEALDCYDRALAVKPDYAIVHSNRGVVLKELHRFEEAREALDRAIALDGSNGAARFNRAILSLLCGRMPDGWSDYEQRRASLDPRYCHRPCWTGSQALSGRKILLYAEQGYGDTLQFCRYVPQIAALGAAVILEVQPPLVALLADLEGVAQIVAAGKPLPDFDYRCALMSLPHALQTTLETIPRTTPYLQSDVGRAKEWRSVLGERLGPRIGLAWSGSPIHDNDHNRSMALAPLLAALPAQFQYVSLQKDVRANDREALESSSNLENVARELHDFSDTAALCESLDLVISVDTSVVHLCGALGKPCWLMLPYHPDWRWLLERDDSPWYPSVRLYRQRWRGDWSGVLARVGADLARELG